MIFISDILLNFLDGERLYEFFEWKEDDLYDHIKRIPLYRVNTKTLYDFIFKDVKCLSLEEIKGQTEVFKTRGIKKIEYAFVLCDIKKAVAFECDKKGNVIARSSLLLDEEEEVLDPFDTIRIYQEKRSSLNAEIDKVLAEIESLLPGGSEA